MVSETAKAKAEELAKDGVSLSFSEVVRLNALGLKVEEALHAADTATARLSRVSFLGEFVVREPTVAHLLWMEQAARSTGKGDDLRLAAYCLSRSAEELATDAPDPDNGRAVNLTVNAFFSWFGPASRFTPDQWRTAIDYAALGLDETADEHGPKSKSEESASARRGSPAAGFIMAGISFRLGSVSEVKGMTPANIAALIASAMLERVSDPRKCSEYASASGEFFAYAANLKTEHEAKK